MTLPTPLPAETLGLATLTQTVWNSQVAALGETLMARLTLNPRDAGAQLDLATLLMLVGNREQGLEMQAQALAEQRCYRRAYGTGEGVRVLAFMVAGDLMANTPIDFLLERSDIELTTVYVEDALPDAADLPAHDVAFLAISQSEDNDARLLALQRQLAGWPRPVVNGRAEQIAALTRDGVAATFADSPVVLAPATRRMARAALAPAREGEPLGALTGGIDYPVIVRPVGSHAGHGLEKLADAAAVADYLARHPEPEFYVSAFVDYSGPDGLFRKLRIVLVRGRPYVSHMAVSARWMVHYLNADMATSDANRAEEAAMMAGFATGFAPRHAAAFAAMTAAFGLDYFGIDCAETRDGRLLLFEADVAMIVHAMDPADLYPYKKPAMARLFEGFAEALSEISLEGALSAGAVESGRVGASP